MARIDEIFEARCGEDFPFPVAEVNHGIAPAFTVKRLLDRKSTVIQLVEAVTVDGNEQTVTVTENGKPRTYTFRRSEKEQPLRVGDQIIIQTEKMDILTITRPVYFEHKGMYYGL